MPSCCESPPSFIRRWNKAVKEKALSREVWCEAYQDVWIYKFWDWVTVEDVACHGCIQVNVCADLDDQLHTLTLVWQLYISWAQHSVCVCVFAVCLCMCERQSVSVLVCPCASVGMFVCMPARVWVSDRMCVCVCVCGGGTAVFSTEVWPTGKWMPP